MKICDGKVIYDCFWVIVSQEYMIAVLPSAKVEQHEAKDSLSLADIVEARTD